MLEKQFVRGEVVFLLITQHDTGNLGNVFLFWAKAALRGSFTGIKDLCAHFASQAALMPSTLLQPE